MTFRISSISGIAVVGTSLVISLATANAQTALNSQIQIVDVQVQTGTDDSEEALSDGRQYTDSSDLELADDAEYLGSQIVGLRFQNIGLPPKAIIKRAWIQFTAKSEDEGRARLSIRAELSPLSAAFDFRRYNISDRQLTIGAVTWAPAAWLKAGTSSDAQRTPDIAALIQETVGQPGWTERSPLVFIIAGKGRRSASAYDGKAMEAARLHVEYSEAVPNNPPSANADTAETAEDTSITIDVLANDSDPDENQLAIAGSGLAQRGIATVNPDQTITYTPGKWFSGTDTFTYTIVDQHGGVASSTVAVTVRQSPNAVDDIAITAMGTPAVINVLENDSDASQARLEISKITQPTSGMARINATGSITYTPAVGFTGPDQFTYSVRNGMGGSTTASVTVNVGTGFGGARFSVIGDFGTGNEDARKVSALVKMLDPEFIVTVGDNIYGRKITPDTAIGQFYAPFIGNYRGLYGSGSSINRFFPVLGNHDWRDVGLKTYLDYFDFPRSSSGNRRYYDFVKGPVHFFMVDSDELEPDGVSSSSVQAQWLKRELAKSKTPWQIVVMHEPPFATGGEYGGAETLQWPFESWGADAVFAGHEHHYERLLKDDDGDGRFIPYFINGSGGAALYAFNRSAAPGSAHRYSDDFGAMIVTATDQALQFEFWSIANGGTLIDKY